MNKQTLLSSYVPKSPNIPNFPLRLQTYSHLQTFFTLIPEWPMTWTLKLAGSVCNFRRAALVNPRPSECLSGDGDACRKYLVGLRLIIIPASRPPPSKLDSTDILTRPHSIHLRMDMLWSIFSHIACYSYFLFVNFIFRFVLFQSSQHTRYSFESYIRVLISC